MRPCGTKGLMCYAGIGSRQTPDPILAIMQRVGKKLCDMGYRLRSGAADGADAAFFQGARLSSKYYESGVEIYLPWNNFNELYESPEEGFWNASGFKDTADRALELAVEARGTNEGLTRGGIALQTRNAYQVLGRFLDDPVRLVICYAKPKSNGRVSGGTNTAVQIAKRFNITVLNLALDSDYERVMAFLKNNENS